MSTAQLVRDQLDHAAVRSFLAPAEMKGSRRAIECEFSRLAAAGDIVRVRKGLYWKGPMTPVGMPLPRPIEVGLAVAGPGSGPAALSAAAHLGLTSQVPSVETVAVPGRTPTEPKGVHFVARSIERRFRGLTPDEVAILEVLRDGPDLIESSWETFVATVTRLVDEETVRFEIISDQVASERHLATRQRWSDVAPRVHQ